MAGRPQLLFWLHSQPRYTQRLFRLLCLRISVFIFQCQFAFQSTSSFIFGFLTSHPSRWLSSSIRNFFVFCPFLTSLNKRLFLWYQLFSIFLNIFVSFQLKSCNYYFLNSVMLSFYADLGIVGFLNQSVKVAVNLETALPCTKRKEGDSPSMPYKRGQLQKDGKLPPRHYFS